MDDRKSLKVTAGSGGLLLLCAALPAARNCGDTYYPAYGLLSIELSWMMAPHLVGLAIGAYALAELRGGDVAVKRAGGTMLFVVGAAWLALLGLLTVTVADTDPVWLAGTAVMYLMLPLWLRVVRRGPPLRVRARRGAVLGGAGCVVWYAMWIIPFVVDGAGDGEDDGLLWGTYASAAAAIALTIAATAAERALGWTPPPETPRAKTR